VGGGGGGGGFETRHYFWAAGLFWQWVNEKSLYLQEETELNSFVYFFYNIFRKLR
jgi:hypothetical protein